MKKNLMLMSGIVLASLMGASAAMADAAAPRTGENSGASCPAISSTSQPSAPQGGSSGTAAGGNSSSG